MNKAQPTQEDEKSNDGPEESTLLPSIQRETIPPTPAPPPDNILFCCERNNSGAERIESIESCKCP